MILFNPADDKVGHYCLEISVGSYFVSDFLSPQRYYEGELFPAAVCSLLSDKLFNRYSGSDANGRRLLWFLISWLLDINILFLALHLNYLLFHLRHTIVCCLNLHTLFLCSFGGSFVLLFDFLLLLLFVWTKERTYRINYTKSRTFFLFLLILFMISHLSL